MSNEDLQKLAKLSKREREVLWLVCEGNSYEEISKKLFISIPTVKANMGRVYVKLGLDQLKQAERVKAIHQIFCSLMREVELPPEEPEPAKPEPVPAYIVSMVNDDERSIIPYQPARVEIIDIQTRPGKTPNPRHPWRMLIVGLILGMGLIACLAIAYFAFFVNRQQPQMALELTKAVAQLTQAAIVQMTQAAIASPLIATQQPAQPTIPPTTQPIEVNTATLPPAPTNTPQPTAVIQPPSTVSSIALPFSDNFDNGANPAWQVATGDWITANGRYSITNTDTKWRFTFLSDPIWKNYQVKVNITRSHPGAFAEGVEVIFVRYLNSESKYLVFYLNGLHQAGWGFYDGSIYVPFISGHIDFEASIPYNVEIDATGNQFIAKVNGMSAQQISLSGYENGGVGLGVFCASTPCSSFDNFQVNPLP